MAALDGLAIAGGETRHEPANRPPRPGRGSMDWDDVRVFLAVARKGSMRAAGRSLGLSQPTIARRLAAFEATFGGATLFDRWPEGLRLSAAGEQLVPAAESVEDAVLTLERRRGADAAAWVAYTDEQAHYAPARWVQRQVEETGKPVALRASSMLMHLEAIRAGTGRGVLPCYVGDGHPLLERLTPPIPELAAEYWIIVHRDLRRAACVRAVIDWMKALFAEQADVLAGNRQGASDSNLLASQAGQSHP